jgi:hypothetical protein
MFKSTYNISIPEPCHENWQAMTVVNKEKFCNACQKNVHDFTKASDKQIIDAFKIDKNLCGRFLDSQLERDIFENKEKSNFWLATISTILSFLALGSSQVSAQEKVKIDKTDNKNILNYQNGDSIVDQKAIAAPINQDFKIDTRINNTCGFNTDTFIRLGNTRYTKRTFFGRLFIRIKVFFLYGF